MINARDVPVAVGADANQKSKTRMLSDGTITPVGGLTFSECQYLAKMGAKMEPERRTTQALRRLAAP